MMRARDLAWALLPLLLAGCQALGPPAGQPPSPPPSVADLPGAGTRLHAQAVEALLTGRAEQARAGFEALAAGDDPALARRARYGAAAAALAAARTPAQAQRALDGWRAWREAAPTDWSPEDPRLLTPAREGLAACLAARAPAADRQEAERLQERTRRLQEENARLKRQLTELEELQRELSQRKHRLNR